MKETQIIHSAYLNGQFKDYSGNKLTSHNPSNNFTELYQCQTSLQAVHDAVSCAKEAKASWLNTPTLERETILRQIQKKLKNKELAIAKTITMEMGKPFAESLVEAKSLSARIDFVIQHAKQKICTENPKDVNGEVRYHPQGVVGIIGPYNFPAHLMNAYVIPALLSGNTVVVKPSEVCPLVGELYAQCFADTELPAGVFNLVQGAGEIGKELVTHHDIDAIVFTGSYETGLQIQKATLMQPWKLVALEMGGKNCSVVLDDAHLDQAVVEILQGAFLTAGQRCTATSRVFVQEGIAQKLISKLVDVTKRIELGDPSDENTFMGPLATRVAFERYCKLIEAIPTENFEALVPHRTKDGGGFAYPSIYQRMDGAESVYLDTELFGPNLCIEIVKDLDTAIERIRHSHYGLSNSIFSEEKAAFEKFYANTKSGVVNWNKSTNGASGLMPFGGMGKSGNQRPGGSETIKLTTYPVACNFGGTGSFEVSSTLKKFLES